MTMIRRCLVHSYEPQRIVKAVKELVARDAEIIASSNTALVLRENGIPVEDIPSFVSSMTGFGEDLELLHPRVQGAVLGRWDDAEQKEKLERLGIRKIDLVLVELPEEVDTGRDAGSPMGAVAFLRSAASNPDQVLTLCELDDLMDVLDLMDRGDSLDSDHRRKLSLKALQAVASFDASLACVDVQVGVAPSNWAIFAKHVSDFPLSHKGAAAGLYRISGVEDLAELKRLSGPPMDAGALVDLDLADAILSGLSDPALVIVHHGSPCGFALVGSQGAAAAFDLARSADPRGSFGAVVGFNREVDGSCARSLSEAYLHAVVAPDFAPEARAELSAKKLTVIKAVGGAEAWPSINSTRWGLAIDWARPAERFAHGADLLDSENLPDADQKRALDIAWAIACKLPAVSLAICDERHMLSCVSGQSSWRESIRLALAKLPADVQMAAAASAQAIRFADEVSMLSNAGIQAIRCVTGSPRQAEVLSKAKELGVMLELIELREQF